MHIFRTTAAMTAVGLTATLIAASAIPASASDIPTPADVSVTTGTVSGTADIGFTPPDDVSEVIDYAVTATDVTDPSSQTDGATVDGSASPLTMTGLTDGDSYTFTVTALSASGSLGTSDPSDPVAIGVAPTISGTVPDVLYVGVPYAFSFPVTGSPAPTVTGPRSGTTSSFCLTDGTGTTTCTTQNSGQLPHGLVIQPSGVLSGTPEAQDASTATAKTIWSDVLVAKNAVGTATSPSFSFQIIQPTAPALAAGSLPSGSLGSPYTASVTATGTPAPALTVTGLPAGLTANAAGALSGTPTRAGTFTVAATATTSVPNGHGTTILGSASRTYPLTIDDPSVHLPAAWVSTTVYHAGDQVLSGGRVFVAQWWTQNERPGSSPYGAWSEVGVTTACAAGPTSAWTESWIYTGGETVAHRGHRWRAQWWTRDQVPGTPHGPWSDLGTC